MQRVAHLGTDKISSEFFDQHACSTFNIQLASYFKLDMLLHVGLVVSIWFIPFLKISTPLVNVEVREAKIESYSQFKIQVSSSARRFKVILSSHGSLKGMCSVTE